jgi:carboxylesterase type B
MVFQQNQESRNSYLLSLALRPRNPIELLQVYLGAHHGEELKFLSDSFPDDWEHNPDDEKLGRAMRSYWTQFAKTGNPNTLGFPTWPAYDPRLDQCFELGRTIGIRPVTIRPQALEHIMKEIFAEAGNRPLQSKSN